LGGSFDPVHYGHLWMAESACEQLRLDGLWWIPAAHSPLKSHRPQASGVQRAEMLELAIAGIAEYRVDRRELSRTGVSYTVDTLREIRQEQPAAELFFIIGADAWKELADWRDPQEIVELATLSVVSRAGHPPVDLKQHLALIGTKATLETTAAAIQMPTIDVSSTQLRARIADHQRIRFRTPHAVQAYIASHGLYRKPHDGPGG
jgi:nicotinate-nucleotide adenylyltransferase